jgi:hypothetical protein
MEASFFVSEEDLKHVQPEMRLVEETALLGAFDANRCLIYATAAKVYARGREGSYTLDTSDSDRVHSARPAWISTPKPHSTERNPAKRRVGWSITGSPRPYD